MHADWCRSGFTCGDAKPGPLPCPQASLAILVNTRAPGDRGALRTKVPRRLCRDSGTQHGSVRTCGFTCMVCMRAQIDLKLCVGTRRPVHLGTSTHDALTACMPVCDLAKTQCSLITLLTNWWTICGSCPQYKSVTWQKVTSLPCPGITTRESVHHIAHNSTSSDCTHSLCPANSTNITLQHQTLRLHMYEVQLLKHMFNIHCKHF